MLFCYISCWRHRSFEILVPTPHNTLSIMGGRDNNFIFLTSLKISILGKPADSLSIYYMNCQNHLASIWSNHNTETNDCYWNPGLTNLCLLLIIMTILCIGVVLDRLLQNVEKECSMILFQMGYAFWTILLYVHFLLPICCSVTG